MMRILLIRIRNTDTYGNAQSVEYRVDKNIEASSGRKGKALHVEQFVPFEGVRGWGVELTRTPTYPQPAAGCTLTV